MKVVTKQWSANACNKPHYNKKKGGGGAQVKGGKLLHKHGRLYYLRFNPRMWHPLVRPTLN